MADFADAAYWLLSYPTFRGAVFAALLTAFVVPAVFELLSWRKG